MVLSEKKVQVSLLFSSSFHFSYETCHNLGVLIGHFQTHPNIIHYFLYPNYITIISLIFKCLAEQNPQSGGGKGLPMGHGPISATSPPAGFRAR